MLFHITQVHSPETCPRDDGGSNTLFYIVEAEDAMAIQRFLWPGFTRCTATVTPVIEMPVQKK